MGHTDGHGTYGRTWDMTLPDLIKLCQMLKIRS